MSQTEAEMWAGMEKTAESGQLVYSGPAGSEIQALEREMFDRGWHDLNLFGMPGRFYQGNSLGLALALQCADVKARDISKVDMLLWERVGRGWRMVEPGRSDIARLLMEQPNDSDMTWPEFWRMLVLHLSMAQNAYVYKDMAQDGTILGLYPLMPTQVRMLVSASGKIFYEVIAHTEFQRAILGDNYFILPADRIIHLRDRIVDGVSGLSNTILGDPTFSLMSAIGDYQTALFGNGGKQTMVFETDQQFGDEAKSNAAFQRLKSQLTERTNKSTATGAPILLEAGLKAKAISLNAKDAATTESFTQQIMRICGLMNVPPHKIFALDSVAYSNMASMDRQYANDSLVPIARNIEIKFRNALLPRRLWASREPQFDRAQLMANDPESLNKLLATAMGTGLMTINEGREVMPFRLNPIAEGGDDRTVPVNMALVKPDGTVRQAAQGQNATQPNPGQDGSPDNNAPPAEPAKGGPRLVASNGAA